MMFVKVLAIDANIVFITAATLFGLEICASVSVELSTILEVNMNGPIADFIKNHLACVLAGIAFMQRLLVLE